MGAIRRVVALLALGAVGGCGTADTLAPNTRAGSDKAGSDRTTAPPAVEPSDADALAEFPSRHLARLHEIEHQERLQEAETSAPLLETLWLTQPAPAAFSSLDLDENGVLNEDDLYSWIDTAERSDQGVIIREYFYDERLDVNADGAVNPLDFHTLRLDVAKRLAAGGDVLEWNGRIVDPAQVIVSSDGASVVTTTPTGYQQLLDLAQVKQDGPVHWKDHGDTGTQEGDDHDVEDPCHEVRSTSFPPTPPPETLIWWEEHPMWCYGVPAGTWTYECTVVVSVVYHNQQDHHLTCGIPEGTITYSLTHTTGSTISAEVGSQVDGIVSLGIQWGQTSSTTETNQVQITLTNPPGWESKYWIRYKAWKIEYTRQAMPEVPWYCDQPYNESASDTIKTTSSETRKVQTRCGCLETVDDG